MSFQLRESGVNRVAGLWAKAGVLALATGAVFSAQAEIAYDALSGAQAHLAQVGSAIEYNYAYQCFTSCKDPITGTSSESITSLGDHVSLAAGTGRVINGMQIGFVEGPSSAAFTFQIQVSIYSTTAFSSLQATQTSGLISFGATPASSTQTGFASIVSLALGPFVLPDSFYYQIAIVPGAGTVMPANFGLWLWDYYQDGTTIPVGTDIGNTGSVAGNNLSTLVYGTTLGSTSLTTNLGTNNNALLINGYTPAVMFTTNAAVVPEPQSYALFFAGLLAIGALSRRNRKN